jgi:hypothetical protein
MCRLGAPSSVSSAAATKDRNSGERSQRFSGDWTTTKLDLLARYLTSYGTALKDKPSRERPFLKACIDAFAGTGYGEMKSAESSSPCGRAGPSRDSYLATGSCRVLNSSIVARLGLSMPIGLHGDSAKLRVRESNVTPGGSNESMFAKSFIDPRTVLLAVAARTTASI